jgi:hypothetical protein
VAQVSGGHIPVERLYEAAEGLGLDTVDVEHLRDCVACREILRIMTRHSKKRLRKENSPPDLSDENASTHVSLVRLWSYEHGQEMEEKDRRHIFNCEACIGILAICRAEESLQDAIEKLKEHGFEIE